MTRAFVSRVFVCVRIDRDTIKFAKSNPETAAFAWRIGRAIAAGPKRTPVIQSRMACIAYQRMPASVCINHISKVFSPRLIINHPA